VRHGHVTHSPHEDGGVDMLLGHNQAQKVSDHRSDERMNPIRTIDPLHQKQTTHHGQKVFNISAWDLAQQSRHRVYQEQTQSVLYIKHHLHNDISKCKFEKYSKTKTTNLP